MNNPFLKPPSSYKRDLDIIGGFIRDTATYLHLNTQRPLAECEDYVTRKVQADGVLSDPKALVLVANEHGDRKPFGVTFMRFLNRVVDQNLLLSPSMAAYVPETVKQSTHSLYISEGTARREEVKNEMFEAERLGDTDLAKIKHGEQENIKLNNNTYSGATVSQATILFHKSTHSTLTSTCRTATSYANASNERFLAGNRHYYNPEVTVANVVSIINTAPLATIEEACTTFGLHLPTPEEALACVRHSSDLYWKNEATYQTLQTMFTNMTPVQRAAVVYVGDLYHLHHHNPEWAVNFLLELAALGDPNETCSDEEYAKFDPDFQMFIDFLCFEQVKSRRRQLIQEEDPETWAMIKATGVRANRTLVAHAKLIEAFWITDCLPPSIHAIPSIYRKAAVISDTDSTMFTMQHIVEKVYGEVLFTPEATRLVFAVVYLISEIITHILAVFSKNMGVTDEKLRLLAMKNEYYFAVLSLTTRSKHYYASQDAREGIMFQEPRMEVKGVGLRDSKVPPVINQGSQAMMREIIDAIKAGKKLNLLELLTRVADVERAIIQSIQSGSAEYLTTGQIKPESGYKNPENSPYVHHRLWQAVFAPDYGEAQEPPYSVVNVSLVASNRTQVESWCARMGNPALAARLQTWLEENNRRDLNTIRVPEIVVETHGVPKEIVLATDIRRIISNTMGGYYLILESLGVYLQDSKNSRLISDYY